MSELTKEYLDEQFKLNKEYFEQHLEQKLNAQTTKLTTELKAFAEEQTEVLARIIQTSVVEPFEKRFDKIDARLDKVDQKFDKLEQALHIKL